MDEDRETTNTLESLLPGCWVQGKVINEALLRLAQLFPDQLYHIDSVITSLAVLRAQPPKQRIITDLNGRYQSCAILLPVNLRMHWILVVIDRYQRQAWIYDSSAPHEAFPAQDSAVFELIRLFFAQYLPFEELSPGPAASCAWDGQGDGGDCGHGQQQQRGRTWTVMYAACPQQRGNSDCGVYVVACSFHLAQSPTGFGHHHYHPQRRQEPWIPPGVVLPISICADAWRYAIAQFLQHMDGGETARHLYVFLGKKASGASSSADASQSSKRNGYGDNDEDSGDGDDTMEDFFGRPRPAGPKGLGQLRSELEKVEWYRDRVARKLRHAEAWEMLSGSARLCLSDILQEARMVMQAEQIELCGMPAGPESALSVKIHTMEEELKKRKLQLGISWPSSLPPCKDDEIEQSISRKIRELEASIEESKVKLQRLEAEVTRRAERDKEVTASVSGLAEAVLKLSGHSELVI